jgi:LPS-assembly lipoprotein
MSLRLSAFILPVLFILAACGFTPMYGAGAGPKNIAVSEGLDTIDIALIPDSSGVYLRNALIDRFYQSGYPSSPRYKLDIGKINETKRDLDITIESEATRKQVLLTTNLTLTDLSTGDVVLTRSLKAITSYNVLGTQFATRIAEADAREAALNDLARQIETQTSLYLKR